MTPHALTHRLALTGDIPTLKSLMAESIRELLKDFLPLPAIEASFEVMGLDTRLIDDGTYFVVECDGAIAGCGGWSRRNTLFGGDQMKAGPDPLLDPAREPARIRAFFVRPAYARRGVGSRSATQTKQPGLSRWSLIRSTGRSTRRVPSR